MPLPSARFALRSTMRPTEEACGALHFGAVLPEAPSFEDTLTTIFWPVLQKTIEINRLTLSLPLLWPDLGVLAKPDTKNGQDFRLAQSAQAISSSLFNLNTSQMFLIRS